MPLAWLKHRFNIDDLHVGPKALLVHRWSWRTIKGQIIIAFILILLLPSIFLNTFFMFQVQKYFSEKTRDFSFNSMAYAEQNIRNLIDSVVLTRKQILSEIVTTRVLEFPDDRSISGINRIKKLVLSVHNAERNAPSISKILIRLGDRYRVASENFAIQSASDTTETVHFLQISPNESVSILADGNFLYSTRSDIVANEIIDHFFIDLEISKEVVARVVNSATFYEGIETYLVDNDGVIVLSSTAAPKDIDCSEFSMINENQSQLIEIESGEIMTMVNRLPGIPLYLVNRIPKSVYASELSRMRAIVVLIGLLISICSVVLAFIVSARITRPLYMFLDSMDRVGHGDFDHRIELDESQTNEDLRRLANDFNIMIDRINKLVENIKVQETANTITQIKALQAQINPHFLYNALDLIRGLAGYGETEAVKRTAISLANLFQYSIKKADEPVPLEEEIRSIEDYLTIQSLRFDDRFKVGIELGEGTEAVLVPRLILQPVVENCYRHGLEPKVGKGNIYIKSTLVKEATGAMMTVTIIDDGRGMDAQTLKIVQSALDGKANSDQLGIGIINVHQRLRLSYGKRSGLTIDSRPDEGTIVCLMIPVSL